MGTIRDCLTHSQTGLRFINEFIIFISFSNHHVLLAERTLLYFNTVITEYGTLVSHFVLIKPFDFHTGALLFAALMLTLLSLSFF